MTSTEMASGSPPVDIDICMIPYMLPIATSMKTVMSDKSMEMDTPDGVVSRMESIPAEIYISRGPDMLQISVTEMEIAGGSPPADIDIYVVPDMLQTEISVTTTEMAGGSPPVDIDICTIPDVLPIAMSVKTVMSDKSMEMDTPDGVVSRMEMTGRSPPAEIDISRGPDMLHISVMATEMAGGSPPADIDICLIPDVLPIAMSVKTVSDMSKDTSDVSRLEVAGGSPPAEIVTNGSPDVLQRAVSVTAVVLEKWMQRFVMNLTVLCLDGLAPDENPARGGSDVGSDSCVIQDPIPTTVSVRTIVAEEWMDRFVLDLVECPSVSRTSAMTRTLGPAVSEEYSPVVFAGGGGGGCQCIPPGCCRVRYSPCVWPTVG